jgi:hypothetical protein
MKTYKLQSIPNIEIRSSYTYRRKKQNNKLKRKWKGKRSTGGGGFCNFGNGAFDGSVTGNFGTELERWFGGWRRR